MRSVASLDNRKALVGGLIIAVGCAVFFLLFFGALRGLLSGDARTVRATFASTVSLHQGDPVRIDGVGVGKVSDLEINPGGRGATVEMELDDSAGELYADARASIRWRTLLGASYAVALDRGTPGLGELGERVIPERRTSYQAELEDITGTLRTDARQGMQGMFRELPEAFADPEEPGRLLDSLADSARDVARGFDALRGQRPNQDIADLVTHTGNAMRALNAPRGQLRRLVQDAALTTQTTAGRADDLRATLSTAAAVLPRARATLGRLDTTLDAANPLIARLTDPAGDIAPAVAALHPVVTDADRLLDDRVQPLVRSLRPTATALATTAREGAPLLDELAPSLERIDQNILPDLAKRSPESRRTTYEMIGPAIAGLNGMAGHYDAESSYVRLLGSGGARAFDALPCRAYFTDPGSNSYLQCQALSQSLQQFFGGAPARRRGR